MSHNYKKNDTVTGFIFKGGVTNEKVLTIDADLTVTELYSEVNSRVMNQGVHMSAAAAGSTGITIANNVNIQPNTKNFSMFWTGNVADWVSTDTSFVYTYQDATHRIEWYISGGAMVIILNGTAYYNLTPTITFVNNSYHQLSVVVTYNSNVKFYMDGQQFGDTISIAAKDMTFTSALYICGSAAKRYLSISDSFLMYNRALSDSEVLSLYLNGIDFADKWGSQTEQTSGTLVIGKRYRINNWITDDDFTNVGGTNEDGNEFVATGTTPTKWTNSSTVVPAGVTLALEPEGIQPSKWYDSSINGLNASYPAAGLSINKIPSLITKQVPNAETTGAVTLTIAKLLSGLITGTPNAARAYTLDTGANIEATGLFNIGSYIDWILMNNDTAAAANIITLTAAAGHTIVGNPYVQSNHATTGALYGSSAHFRTIKTAASTYVTYRMA